MVVTMMKWRPRPSKKFEAKITLHHLRIVGGGGNYLDCSRRFSAEITWKGSSSKGIIGLRKKRVRRNFTKEQPEDLGGGDDDGVVVWDEEFRCVCSFSSSNHKDKDSALFHPWELSFALLLNGDLNQGTKTNNVPVVGTASLNLADFASAPEKQDTEINIPLSILPGGLIDANTSASLHLSISLLELRNPEEPSSILSFPRSPCYGEILSSKKEAIKIESKKISTRKRSQRKVNIFDGLSAIRAKRTGREEEYCSDRNSSVRSDEDMGEVKHNSHISKSFDYGTLAYANNTGVSSIHRLNTSNGKDEDWIYYSHSTSSSSSVYDPPQMELNNSKSGILLPWGKRKLSFRSPKVKGEPLLRKDHQEEGGDDIDFDRRHLSSSSDESTSSITQQQQQKESGGDYSPFGDDNFAVGTWESKEIISRDGEMKLKTQVFFASIDQRSESAAGESACTALVAVIADWFQSNTDVAMLIKSQLDSLIREGSLEWRNLCENETYRERFPDKHFDLDTVLEAKVRPISVVPEKSFVGFFRPQGIEDKGFDFLKGVMSFDDIWDEIPSCSDPLVYIISWNDHFFVLKVEEDAYYIIDTLGERLYEGCKQAFILKFDRDTVISRIVIGIQKLENKRAEDGEPKAVTSGENEGETSVVCTGKESCKEYIKNFLAAIPIRELEVDLKKGLMASTPLHHRLQIEFHYTRHLQNLIDECSCSTIEAIYDDNDDDDDDDDDAKANLPTSEPEK